MGGNRHSFGPGRCRSRRCPSGTGRRDLSRSVLGMQRLFFGGRFLAGGGGLLGLERIGAGHIGLGLGLVALLVVGVAAERVRLRIGGIQGDGLAEIGQGLVPLPLLLIGDAAVDEGVGVLGD